MARLPISWALCLPILLLVLPVLETSALDCVNGTCASTGDTVVANSSGDECCNTNSTVPVAAIVVPVVLGGLLLVVVPVAIYCFIKVRNKRRDEGTYNPNMQEKSSTTQTGPPGGLQRPPEERLI